MVESRWAAYVQALLVESGKSEAAFLQGIPSVQQGTFNRWKNGVAIPDKAAHVAAFAMDADRNVLEAFVAAGMLDIDTAGKGLPAKSRRFLDSLSEQRPNLRAVAKRGEVEPPSEEHP